MPRKAKDIRQHRFNLNYADESEAKLHDHLLLLAEEGKASDWIISILIRAMGKASTQEVHVEDATNTRQVQSPNGMQPATPKYSGARPFSKAEQVGKK